MMFFDFLIYNKSEVTLFHVERVILQTELENNKAFILMLMPNFIVAMYIVID
ncbi:hypothetical protein Xekj_03513 [Xenorhabdus sp. KJ12.1]|nr:hypothetical protein Xekj_03513 [Xenorhabdus sp. KJ12.1]